MQIKLTQYSHGAGCGCKISPATLREIVHTDIPELMDPALLVGNRDNDDAAAYDLGDGQVILSTTDFFMPIVDDPHTFGRIAATNAMSDIYAMGGTPMMAIAILGWPVNTLPPEVARQVVEGGRQACRDAGIVLAGGHSIDAPEPIFGLAVTGRVDKQQLKQNNLATAGCQLFLTKPIGIGILTTAQKQAKLLPEHEHLATDWMCRLNTIGAELATLPNVKAMTDVTGFGLLGHLLELCKGSGLQARLSLKHIPLIEQVPYYLEQGCVPGGTQRNFDSFSSDVSPLSEPQKHILCDPQTSGGLLIAAEPDDALLALLKKHELACQPIGELVMPEGEYVVQVED